MKKYFLLIIPSSVAEEIKFQLKGTRNKDERDIRNRICDYVEKAGIKELVIYDIREVPMPDDRCALYYRNGYADGFDAIDDFGKPLDFFMLNEEGNIIGD